MGFVLVDYDELIGVEGQSSEPLRTPEMSREGKTPRLTPGETIIAFSALPWQLTRHLQDAFRI
jgi:hypothetical protein